jgi:hypothetical protein
MDSDYDIAAFDESGELVMVLTSSTDISFQKQAEQKSGK